MSACRSCGATAEWGVFQSGKRALFDVDLQEAQGAKDESLWVLEEGAVDEQGRPILLARRAEAGERGVTCHFATCPDRDAWRRR